ncbi:hypothetical protein F5B19DRAFT_142573 [Rostrohypoxylon terebratum]|nr:hypothetical protein F5B19DRAFT_142573 [Rostrohypoxylon terebratum]
MATPKRQKWLEVFNENSGTYEARLISHGQSPIAELPVEAQGQSAEVDVDEEKKTGGLSQQQTNRQDVSPVSTRSNYSPMREPSQNSSNSTCTHEYWNASSQMSDAWDKTSEDKSTDQDVRVRLSTTVHEHMSQEPSRLQDQFRAATPPRAPSLATLTKQYSPRISKLAALVKAQEVAKQATLRSDTSADRVSPSPLDDQDRSRDSSFRPNIIKGVEKIATTDWNAIWDSQPAAADYCYGDDFGGLDYECNPNLSDDQEECIKAWILKSQDAVAEIIVNLHPPGLKEPDSCVVDPQTGDLMEPIEHPIERGVKHRVKRADMTTVDQICRAEREAHKAAQRRYALEILETEEKYDELRQTVRDAYPYYTVLKKVGSQETAKQGGTSQQEKSQPDANAQRIANPHEIKVPIHLRPARKDDLAQIADIYNKEFETIFDKLPVKASEFLELYNNALKLDLPLLVAVNGWYDPEEEDVQIVGFGLMDTAIKGIAGSHATHAGGAGKLTIVVHKSFRRLNICSAMLDAVLYCCSTNYKPVLGYQFVNPDDDHRLMKPEHNPRQWNTIDIEVVVWSRVDNHHGDEDKRDEWIQGYLNKYFQMVLISRDIAMYKVDDAWCDILTFRHRCRRLDV